LKTTGGKVLSNWVTTSDSFFAFILPPTLDGSHGSNRALNGIRQTAADTDVEAVRLWLAEYAGSPHTLRNYRKEAVRLLVWATQGLGKALSSLNREDLLVYESFLAHPSGDWIDRGCLGISLRRAISQVTRSPCVAVEASRKAVAGQ
jgi:hypothetical protein